MGISKVAFRKSKRGKNFMRTNIKRKISLEYIFTVTNSVIVTRIEKKETFI